MDIRRKATDLSDGDRDQFLEAVIRLKHKPAPGGPAGLNVYDQYVALHAAVMAVIPPGAGPGETVNYGHWNIGFCAWHRQYLRAFEKELQTQVPGVTLPYWDWTDHVAAVNRLFTPTFLGSLRTGPPGPVPDGVLRNPVPTAQRPPWWPAGATGFAIHPQLREGMGARLARGSVGVGWPPTAAAIQQLEQLVITQPGAHPFWFFWSVLEAGETTVTSRTHNRGHNFIGGHMSGAFSPNDPIFWLHHANVDRLWANWQARRLAAVVGSKPENHYPPPGEASPLDGDLAPPGHRLDDAMWPWVGGAAGFDLDIEPAVRALLPDFSTSPTRTVKQVLDTETIDPTGYRYAPPSSS